MIVAEQKPLEEIKEMIAPYDKVLILGCGTCVTVCFAGGEKEVAILASTLRMATRLDGAEKEILEATVQRQCEYEYNDEVAERIQEADVVLSLACGIGVQTMNEQFPDRLTLPGLNTTFLGQPTEQGVPGPHRWHLSHRPVCQEPAQRAVRWLPERSLRG